jgi:hypothetical protein
VREREEYGGKNNLKKIPVREYSGRDFFLL